MEMIQKNKIPICIASIQWFVTTVFQVDRLFFSYELDRKYLITTISKASFEQCVLSKSLFHFQDIFGLADGFIGCVVAGDLEL